MSASLPFLDSQTYVQAVRVGAVALALAVGTFTGRQDAVLIAGVAVAFAAYASALTWTPREKVPQMRSPYVPLVGDSVFSGLVAFAVATPVAAFAFPAVAIVCHRRLYAGYGGALAAGLSGAAATIGLGSGYTEYLALAGALPVLGGVAALSIHVARSETSAEEARAAAERSALSDAGASRVLEGVAEVGASHSREAAIDAMASGLLSASGLHMAAVYMRNGSTATLAASRPGFDALPEAPDELSLSRETPAGRVAAQAVAITVGYRNSRSDAEEALPAWAREAGYNAGVIAPLTAGRRVLGVALILEEAGEGASLPVATLERVERLAALGGRLLAAFSSEPQQETDRLAFELDNAGRSEDLDTKEPITLGGLSLEPDTDRTCVGGVQVSLSRTEFDLLYALANSAGSVIDQDSLRESAWGESADTGQRAVDATIYRLRRKLAKAPSGSGLIKTVRGKGYVLIPPSEN